MDAVGSIMNGMSSYYSAAADYEVNIVTKKYDKQIEAAGKNSKKTKKLEEQKEKEIAKIKTKYNKKAMAIQIAQATASTAFNAISAFGAVLQKEQPWTVPLAYAAAAAATASGMLQIAAIKNNMLPNKQGIMRVDLLGESVTEEKPGSCMRVSLWQTTKPWKTRIFCLSSNSLTRRSATTLWAVSQPRT